MSIIVSRALPDVRDGLKPVHRRILYAMNELGMTPDKPYKKSARIVGEVIGEIPSRTAMRPSTKRWCGWRRTFRLRYMLVDGHGNFGSIDGDAAAAMRYTEARLSKIAMEMLRDINKETIDFVPELRRRREGTDRAAGPFSEFARQRRVRDRRRHGDQHSAAQFGRSHRRHAGADHNPDITPMDLMEASRDPISRLARIILGRQRHPPGYATGRGSITMRAKADIEETAAARARIIVERIAVPGQQGAVWWRKSPSWSARRKSTASPILRDESDRNGMRIVIELRRDVNPNVVLNNLYKHTPMQIELRHQHAGARRRRAENAELARNAVSLFAAPDRSHPPPHRVRSERRRKRAPTFWKGCASRWTTWTK